MAKSATPKTPWFDATSEAPLLQEYARKLDSFVDAIADGRVESRELEEQERRLVALMKEVEPMLSPEAHDKVTQLLCEVTAYDLMNMLYMAGRARPRARFQG